jgi:hypothetical protein
LCETFDDWLQLTLMWCRSRQMNHCILLMALMSFL